MRKQLGRFSAAIALAFSLAGCSNSPSSPEKRIVYADGITLHLASFDGTALHDVSTASIPSAGLLGGHLIFSIVEHPTQQLLYVTSFNDCGADVDTWCWGNGRVDIFKAAKNKLTWQKVAFLYDADQTIATCTADDWGYEGQVGGCAPVNGVFSADGSRFYVQDDDNDVLHIFSVGSDGTLTLLQEGGDLDQHGLARSATGDYLYNGTNVLTITGDEGVNGASGSGGNDTVILDPSTGDDLLFTTTGSGGIAVYALTDPAAPVEVDTLAIGSQLSRSAVMNAGLTRAVAVGRNSVSTVAFDGATLTLEDTLTLAGDVDIENRAVVFGDDTHALVASFAASSESPSLWSGAVDVYAIAEDGTLTAGANVALDNACRAIIVTDLK